MLVVCNHTSLPAFSKNELLFLAILEIKVKIKSIPAGITQGRGKNDRLESINPPCDRPACMVDFGWISEALF